MENLAKTDNTEERILSRTQSLCPECLEFLDAEIFEKDSKVWIKKNCKEHGEFLDLYFGDYEMYKKFMKFAREGKGIANPLIKDNPVCPKTCGMCSMHLTHTALGNIVVTNNCDLRCWYCFFFAEAAGYVYEPTLEQIRSMLRSMKQQKPVGANAVQLTGGNPEVREDLVEIIKIAKEEGYDHIQLNINGTHKLAWDTEWSKAVKNAGVNTVYLSFDGTTPKTNPKNHYEIPFMLENCRKANLGVVLVPTIVNTVNDSDIGNILRFGLKNIDLVRGINFQPVSLVGRITKADVKKFRITIPDVIKRMEEQTNGMVSKEDFYPIPVVSPITKIVEALSSMPKYDLTTHSVCGAATYLFIEDGKIIPLPSFVDVEGLLEFLEERAEEIKQGKSKVFASLKMLAKLSSFIDKKKQPKNLNLAKILFDILLKKDYNALSALHEKSLFIGMMHFMDLYNYDIERVKRCCIHYAQPDGKIVPFCAFNVIPQWYRDNIQKKSSLPITDWENKTGRKLNSFLYKRDAEKLSKNPVYLKAYEGFI